jgi:hypothetical protein
MCSVFTLNIFNSCFFYKFMWGGETDVNLRPPSLSTGAGLRYFEVPKDQNARREQTVTSYSCR